jgi:redox-sensitive bicupin YhaK (pirin superfamily)
MDNKTKKVEIVLAPPAPHMVGDGFRVHNFFPSGYTFGYYRMSPFFLMDYNSKVEFPPKDEPRGVGVHPHRGFETVTIAYQGKVAHHDSAGNSGVIGSGDVQWMTAGSGILHKEYHEEKYSQQGGPFQMVQLWVNLPAKDKMSTPKYQGIAREQMGQYNLPETNGTVEVIAGEYKGVKGAATTFTPINMYNMRLKKGVTESFSLPENYNTGILILEGSITVNGSDIVPTDHFVLFKNEGAEISVTVKEDAVLLVLSGEPIKEDLFPHGPFLMNTKEEILQAFDDLAKGKFGQLED